ncbi:MAG: DUF711 family protein [Promethearchaeota archaeon]
MKIRAITLGTPIEFIEEEYEELEEILNSIGELKNSLLDEKMEVQTIRLCTPPFSKDTHLNQSQFFKDPSIVLDALDELIEDKILDYYSAFSGLCNQSEHLTITQKKLMRRIPELLVEHENMFSSIQVGSSVSLSDTLKTEEKGRNILNLEAISESAGLIKQLSKIDPFMNLKFAVTINVPPNTPFFPSAYHLGKNIRISIALEAADEILNIVNSADSFSEIQIGIKEKFKEISESITNKFLPLCQKQKIDFYGIDFSPAPFPTKDKSIGTAVEKLGLGKFGEQGTLFSIGLLTSALKSGAYPKIGFSGFMQPILEDYTIGTRNIEGLLDTNKLILNSAVCGLGLDCVPLPGDISKKSITLLIMDLAMLSLRCNKPLTARLMPIPGKNAGDLTEFSFDYFKNSAVLNINENSISDEELSELIRKNPFIIF